MSKLKTDILIYVIQTNLSRRELERDIDNKGGNK